MLLIISDEAGVAASMSAGLSDFGFRSTKAEAPASIATNAAVVIIVFWLADFLGFQTAAPGIRSSSEAGIVSA